MVRNTWVIYRKDWNNLLKGELTPDVNIEGHSLMFKVGDRKA